ncbi:MAG: TIGR02391 family protein, partial [Bacteroidales bacterium]|nr:TIGR02391 family protein [Candidatus Scybalocola fimicaballi]
IYPQCTKRVRLFNALAERQNRDKCSNQILTFIKLALSPNHFVGKNDDYEKLRALINYQLAFVGYELKADGQYREIPKASTLADVKIKVDNLKGELEKRNAHQEIFKYCTAELVANNYFHSVLEACKGLFQRIRELSGIHEDGIKLIEQAFSSNPILIINNYQSNSEKNEHNGFCNLLKGLCSMFRNTTAHEPKIEWDMEEIDAIDILGTISYCHRRLDKAQKIR